MVEIYSLEEEMVAEEDNAIMVKINKASITGKCGACFYIKLAAP